MKAIVVFAVAHSQRAILPIEQQLLRFEEHHEKNCMFVYLEGMLLNVLLFGLSRCPLSHILH